MNIAERAGRWSAAHWKTAFFGWLALVAVAVVAGSLVGTHSLNAAEQTSGDSARAETMLAAAGFDTPAGESVLVQAKTGRSTDPAFRAAVSSLTTTLRGTPDVEHVRRGAVSHDGRSELVDFDIAGDSDTAGDRVQPALDAVASVQRTHPSFSVAEFGSASGDHAGNEVINGDLHRAELLSVPITFVILLLAFGAFVAAGVPVLLAFSAVLGTIGLGAVASHVVHASDTTSSVVLLMGMAVGVDYSLFYLKREREERAGGLAGRDALHAAAASSGKAVLVSGLTVVVACGGMLLSGSNDFFSMGVGTMLVVFVAMVGSLTVLPAILGRLGDRVDRGLVSVLAAGFARVVRVLGREPAFLLRLRDRRTLLQRAKGDRAESRLWAAVLRPVLRRPRTATVVAVALLAGLALPAFGMRTAQPGVNSFPPNLPIVKTYHAMEKAFPGSQIPAVAVVQAPNVDAPAVRNGIAKLRRDAIASGVMYPPITVKVNARRTVARIEVPLAGNSDDSTSIRALRTLRSQVLPASLGGVAGVEYAVTGDTAQSYDFGQTLSTHTPFVFAFVVLVAFGVLLLAFGSLVVPLTAIALNLLSVGAAYGILVWIFQEGHLQGLLGFQSNGAIITWMPLFMFTILFGLSMDYHVFIVSRIRELVRGGSTTEDAVAQGIRTTASTVTSAALVMVAVFSIFALTRTLVLKELGVGLAAAVLLDATVIRGVLLPAAMTILGERNWYLPRRLRWLPRFELETATASKVGSR